VRVAADQGAENPKAVRHGRSEGKTGVAGKPDFAGAGRESFLPLWPMPKWGKLIIGLLLLPVCVGGAQTLVRVLAQTGDAQTFWVAALGGAACWWVVYLLLPKPMWVYVVGHELTHVFWTWLFGGRVHKFKASAKGGQIVADRTNFLIALAPYFFPVYAVLVVLIFLGGDLIWNWTHYRPWFHFPLGAAYAFHVTLTWHILHTRQSDITSQGYLFSAVVIFLGNLSVLIVAIPLLAGHPGLLTALSSWCHATGGFLASLGRVGRRFF
jgi:hypothetical protein